MGRDVARNLLRGTNQGIWGTEVPQQGPGAEPRRGSEGEAPRSQRHVDKKNKQTYGDGGTCTHVPPLATPLDMGLLRTRSG